MGRASRPGNHKDAGDQAYASNDSVGAAPVHGVRGCADLGHGGVYRVDPPGTGRYPSRVAALRDRMIVSAQMAILSMASS